MNVGDVHRVIKEIMSDGIHLLKVLSFLSVTFILTACQHEPVEPEPAPPVPTTGTLRMVIVPQWEGVPFALNSIQTNVNDYRVKVEFLKMYLGDVRLMNGNDSTNLDDIELFNFSNSPVVAEWPAAPGTWSVFRAGLGVPSRLNDADPIVYPPGHPLDLNNGTWWTWASGYRFVIFDGRYDTDANGAGSPIAPFSMHTGMNAVYREFDLALGNGITITAGNTTTLTLDLAIDRFFYSATDTLDLVTENQTHGENIPLAMELTDNVIGSFSVH